MVDDREFLESIAAAPDADLRAVYADFLEEQGDELRSELIRLDLEHADLDILRWSAGMDQDTFLTNHDERLKSQLDRWNAQECEGLRDHVAYLCQQVDERWLAFMRTLGRPFEPCCLWNADAASPHPFREEFGSRGGFMMFASDFRDLTAWDQHLLRDLKYLNSLRPDVCARGTANCPVRPFVCELPARGRPLTAADVIEALRVQNFRSAHTTSLSARQLDWPGFHPFTENDEIHTQFSEQVIFPIPRSGRQPPNSDSGRHGWLKHYVYDQHLWYVLLHTWTKEERRKEPWVVLFAVGASPHGNRLVGVVTHEFCPNLCN